jgi:hypothetical protein
MMVRNIPFGVNNMSFMDRVHSFLPGNSMAGSDEAFVSEVVRHMESSNLDEFVVDKVFDYEEAGHECTVAYFSCLGKIIFPAPLYTDAQIASINDYMRRVLKDHKIPEVYASRLLPFIRQFIFLPVSSQSHAENSVRTTVSMSRSRAYHHSKRPPDQ